MFPIEQMLMIPDCHTCYKNYGIHGLYYAILFGWAGSPYRNKTNEEERDTTVYDAIRLTEIFDYNKGKMAKPDKTHREMYKNPHIKKAIQAIIQHARIPTLELRAYYTQQIDELMGHKSNIVYNPADAATFKKQLDTVTAINNAIESYTKTISGIDRELEQLFKVEKRGTLDLLMANAQ